MATPKVIVEGSSVTASQMKDFWRQASEGTIDGAYMQAVLAASRDRRAMLVEGREFKDAVIHIDRERPFYSWSFHAKVFNVGEEDERSLALTEVNLGDIQLVPMLEDGETKVIGEQNLERLKKAGHVRLDVKVFQTLWQNQNLIPASWKQKRNGETMLIHFDGSVMLNESGNPCVFYLAWDGDRWTWDDYALQFGRMDQCVSAVIRQPEPEKKVELFRGLSATINLGKPTPRVPSFDKKWGIKEHHGGDVVTVTKDSPNDLYIGGKKVVLCQTKQEVASGYTLKTELKGKPILNANVFDFLWENKEFIPEDWKRDRRDIHFLGTVFHDADGILCVRAIYFHENSWHTYAHSLEKEWTKSWVALLEG